MFDIFVIALLVILVITDAFLIYLYFSSKKTKGEEDNAKLFFEFMQNEIRALRDSFDKKLTDTTKNMHESVQTQFKESQKLVDGVVQQLMQVKKELGSFSETNKQVISYTEQLKRLQDVLTNPKQRGVLGEYYLEAVLQNVLPPNSYKMQYGFQDGQIVDAAIFVKDKIIPVDSKFSLENYNRMLDAKDNQEKERYVKLFKSDLKNRIDETSKYIRPEEGTVEFAFMFIPSEGVYYDLVVNKVGAGVSARDLIEYAFSKKVIIVSPTSFLAYLQTVLQGLKMLQIEESAKEIRKRVEMLGKHLIKYEESYNKLGKSLKTTVSHYNTGYKELAKVDKDILKITGEKIGVEADLLDAPDLD